MAKKIVSSFYTFTNFHTRRENTPYLYSKGKYKTKIAPADLPEWYIPGQFYGNVEGFLSAKGVKRLLYKPNLVFNHMFRDDLLYISYDERSTNETPTTEYDEYIWGNNIPRFLVWAEKYSGYDVSDIENQIENKRLWYMNAFPYEYEQEIGKDENILDFYRSLYEEIPA